MDGCMDACMYVCMHLWSFTLRFKLKRVFSATARVLGAFWQECLKSFSTWVAKQLRSKSGIGSQNSQPKRKSSSWLSKSFVDMTNQFLMLLSQAWPICSQNQLYVLYAYIYIYDILRVKSDVFGRSATLRGLIEMQLRKSGQRFRNCRKAWGLHVVFEKRLSNSSRTDSV